MIGPIATLAVALWCAPQDTAAPASGALTAAPDCIAPDADGRRADDWRRIASDADRARLRNWREAWTKAQAGEGIPADAALFAPDVALADATPPPGRYRCRTYHLGPSGAGATPASAGCRVEEDKGLPRFVVEDGAQRPIGHFYRDTANRAVFLGTVLIGDEARPLRYGRDRLRDRAGFVERVAPQRWRVVMPRPSFGGELDLIELVPE